MNPLTQKNQSRKLYVDEKVVKEIEDFIATGIPRGSALEVLKDLVEKHGKLDFFTAGQRALVKSIKKDYEDYPYQVELRDALQKFYAEGKTPPEATNFIDSVLKKFEEYNRFTDLQREQIIKIVDKCLEENEEEVE